MTDFVTPPVAVPTTESSEEKEPSVQKAGTRIEDESRVDEKGQESNVTFELTARDLLHFWDSVNHCAESQHCNEITQMLKAAVEEQPGADQAKQASNVDPAPPKENDAMLNQFEMEFFRNRYQVSWTTQGKPRRHESWPSDFCLIIDEDDRQNPCFQVFKTKIDSLVIDTTNPERTSLAYPEWKTNPDHLVYQFGRKYVFGPSALNKDGTPKTAVYDEKYDYNYAEHRIIGDRLRLRFSESETVIAGSKPLTLENGNRLTYGQINGLGGDFFATNNPICTGSDFNQQCQYFQDAYNLLGKAQSGLREAPLIDNINAEETQAVQDAIKSGKSTHQVYKELAEKHPGRLSDFGVTQKDEDLSEATMKRDGPSYARMALLNLDHFGHDACTAYNAGHTCALRVAAAGNLEIGYAMNAFADHYLGDCFASGHIRTPRRTLHASGDTIARACGAIYEVYQEFSSRGVQGGPAMVAKILSRLSDFKDIFPDMCSKFMHDEDNSLGLVVVNNRGDRWTTFGDSKLFEKENATNAKFLQEALQASADEVYNAYTTKIVPTDVHSFAAWRIAPAGVDQSRSHYPMFRQDGHYRINWSSPWSSDYADPKSFTPTDWMDPIRSIPSNYWLLWWNMKGSDYIKSL